jgi:ribose-phosphate pyrophosphokinase
MSIIVQDKGHVVPYSRFVFAGGEVQVKVKIHGQSSHDIKIYAILKNSDDVMELFLATDAIRNQVSADTPIHLIMPYVPYARQDRVVNRGEALSIRVFCNLINSQDYASVTIHDPHSDVTSALLKNVNVLNQTEVMRANLPFGETPIRELTPKAAFNAAKRLEEWAKNVVLVAPDAGAIKKITDVANAIGFEHIVRADKKRDTKTLEILETVVYSDHVGNKDFLIVDDICDGGRTFLELAKVLRPLTNGKIILYVTHGIFSRGLGAFKGVIDEVYCDNSFEQFRPNTNLMNQN